MPWSLAILIYLFRSSWPRELDTRPLPGPAPLTGPAPSGPAAAPGCPPARARAPDAAERARTRAAAAQRSGRQGGCQHVGGGPWGPGPGGGAQHLERQGPGPWLARCPGRTPAGGGRAHRDRPPAQL